MKIASVGMAFEYEHPSINELDFGSNETFLDYDLLIWEPNTLLDGFNYDMSTYQGYPYINDNYSARLLDSIKRRQEEMGRMLSLGRCLVICIPEPRKFYVATGKKEYSGTGRNRQVTNIVTSLDLKMALPFAVETVTASGKSIELREGEPFKTFWEKNKKLLVYKAYFQASFGKPFLFIKGTQLAVGIHLQSGKGNVIFIPSLRDPEETEEDAGNIFKEEEDFIMSLVSLAEELKKETGDFALPIWSNDYALPGEREAQKALTDLENNLKGILTQIDVQKNNIAELESYKLLFTGTGRALEIQIKKVLEKLGFTVTEGLPGRDDLILKLDGRTAVVEVKGVTKSAAEKQAAQLEKWVSEYFSLHGTKPKGILIVNAFKDIPLSKRKEAPFPEQMLDYCKRRGHCLITGQQLLSLYLDCKDNDDKKLKMLELMFDTEGVFDEYQDWTKYIELENRSEEKLAVKEEKDSSLHQF